MAFLKKRTTSVHNFNIESIVENFDALECYFNFEDVFTLKLTEKLIQIELLNEIDFEKLRIFSKIDFDNISSNFLSPKYLLFDFLCENPNIFLEQNDEVKNLIKNEMVNVSNTLKALEMEYEIDFLYESEYKLIKSRCVDFLSIYVTNMKFESVSKKLPFKSFFELFDFIRKDKHEIIS